MKPTRLINSSDFRTYPHRVFASVVLLDGKIVNWKVGNWRWTKETFWHSLQPSNVSRSAMEAGRIAVRSRSYMAKDEKEHNKIFSKKTKPFFRKFEIYKPQRFPCSPYEEMKIMEEVSQ